MKRSEIKRESARERDKESEREQESDRARERETWGGLVLGNGDEDKAPDVVQDIHIHKAPAHSHFREWEWCRAGVIAANNRWMLAERDGAIEIETERERERERAT